MQGLPTLIVGVGGTGLKVLWLVKERLMETWHGKVPPHIVLLALDTQPQPDIGTFPGVRLREESFEQDVLYQPEMHVLKPMPSFVLQEKLDRARRGDPMWKWLDADTMQACFPVGQEMDLKRVPAFRQMGRALFFYNATDIKEKLGAAMTLVFQPHLATDDHMVLPGQDVSNKTRRTVFVVGSVAGTTGSGMLLDTALLLRSIMKENAAYSGAFLNGIIALPHFFHECIDESGQWKPNTYAALRELERWMNGITPATPYRLVFDNEHESILDTQLFDFCYLIDGQDYNGDSLVPRADQGALPAIADMIVAHTDKNFGTKLNSMHVNVSSNYYQTFSGHNQHDSATYHYQKDRSYSALNAHTIIFPREDVIQTLGLRFLIEILDIHLVRRGSIYSNRLAISDKPVSVEELVDLLSMETPTPGERMKAGLSTPSGDMDMGVFLRMLLRESRHATAPYLVKRDGVFFWLIEDSMQRKETDDFFTRSIQEITRDVTEKRYMPHYVQRTKRWLNTYLGTPEDEQHFLDSRRGGSWNETQERLVSQAHPPMRYRLRELVLRMLNQRDVVDIDGIPTNILRADRPGYALAVLYEVRNRVLAFQRRVQEGKKQWAGHIKHKRQTLHDSLVFLQTLPDDVCWPKFNPGPAHLERLKALAEAELQGYLYEMILNQVAQCNTLLEEAIAELEAWTRTLRNLCDVFAAATEQQRDRHRKKHAIKSRSYITNINQFPQASSVEDELAARYHPTVWRMLLGTEAEQGSLAGLSWEYTETGSFSCTLVSQLEHFTIAPHTRKNSARIAEAWQVGIQQLFAHIVRQDKVARVASYVSQFYNHQIDLVKRLLQPNSHALIALYHINPNPHHEHRYLAVNPLSDDERVTRFYDWFRTSNWETTNQTWVESESTTSCTYLTLYHGLELEHIAGFREGESLYQKFQQAGKPLHVFCEEQHAFAYEQRIQQSTTAYLKDHPGYLHTEIIACLNNPRRVCSFALALFSTLITLRHTKQKVHTTEYVLAIPGKDHVHLSNSTDIVNYSMMQEQDRVIARLLQAFQTFMLRGHAVGVPYAEHIKIDYAALDAWLNTTYCGVSSLHRESLVQAWESYVDGTGVSPLSVVTHHDPRFRDLAVILLLELYHWAKSPSL